MQIDSSLVLAGLIVGFLVGMTGMGGGALMTPILVLLFKVQPLAAVSSDLVASVFMRPFGAAVHWRKGTVNTEVVKWLMVGSVPAAFLGVVILKTSFSGPHLQSLLSLALGVVLVFAAAAMVLRNVLQGRSSRFGFLPAQETFATRPVLTMLIGAVGGLVVGITSVGSGSLMIVMLMLLYPAMRGRSLVGTDLAQSIPLVAAAALGHLLFGDFRLNVTAALVIGSVPGVLLGAMLGSRAPDLVVRPLILLVLLASGLKLLHASNVEVGLILGLLVLIGVPLWGLADAARWSHERWTSIGRDRRRWMAVQAVGTVVLGLGVAATVAYVLMPRPELEAALQKAHLS